MTNADKYVADQGLSVDVLNAVDDPDRLVAQCARGDTAASYIGEGSIDDLLEGVPYDDSDVDTVLEHDLFPHNTYIDTESASRDHPDVIRRGKIFALLERLFRREHWGPFEHANITLGLKNVSIQTERQLTRHRLFTFDVQSLRYVDLEDSDVAMLMPKSAADADHATRHGTVDLDEDDREAARTLIEKSQANDVSVYNKLRDLGMPPEDARVVLGLGTQIHLSMTGNLRSYLHILNLRADAGDAQWEIRGMGDLLKEQLRRVAPITLYLWDQHGPMVDGP